jgi:hypothetical protein
MEFSGSQNISSAKNASLDMDKWRSLVKAWDATKENQKEYCQRLGINLNTFSYVRGKLIKKEKRSPKFIPIVLSQSEELKIVDRPLLTLESPRGFKLHISPALSLEQLTNIFRSAGW